MGANGLGPSHHDRHVAAGPAILRPMWIGISIVMTLLAAVFAARWYSATRESGRQAGVMPVQQEPSPANPGLGHAFERMPKPAIHVDDSLRLTAMNEQARAAFPFLRAGQLLLEAFGEHRLSDTVAESMRNARPSKSQVQLFTDDRRTYRIVVEPVTDGTAASGALIFITDLTEGIAYQELRSQFVANVSHELRTPITGLRGLLEALTDDDIEEDMRQRFATRAIAETQRLEALITDILFLSELEAVPAAATRETTDLCAATTAAVELLGDLAEEHSVTIETTLPDRAVFVPLGDRLARTIGINLVENAIKYGGPSTHVQVALAVEPDGGECRLTVTDTGPGIDEHHLPHIFERFYRVDASRSKRMGGTGLGLSIVKHIIERSGGTIAAESRLGFGTTVSVTLPTVEGGSSDDGDRVDSPSDATR